MKVSFLSPQLTKWIVKLALLIFIVATVSYIFFLNPEVSLVKLPSGVNWQAPMAMILIVTFCLGLIAASLVALLIGIRQKILAWQARRAEKQLAQNHLLILEGREHRAAGDFNRAKLCFDRIILSNPDNILARLFLAETLSDQGLFREAINVLDDARQNQKNNIELLFLAAQINIRLDNYTAAYDNLSLILKTQPQNKVALNRLVEVGTKLKRFEEALAFQDRLVMQSPASENQQLKEKRAAIELEFLLSSNLVTAEFEKALEDLLRRCRDYPPALAVLARIYESRRDWEGAIKLLSRAFKQSCDLKILNSLANIWQKNENPDKAVNTVKNALLLVPQDGETYYRGSLFLCSFYIYLGMIDQALKEIEALEKEPLFSRKYYVFITFLIAQTRKRRGEFEEATNCLETSLIATGALQEAPFYFKME